MKLNKMLLVVLLISGLILLSACLPEATTTPAVEQEEPVQSGAAEDSYPAPEGNEEVQFADSDHPYPGPQTIMIDHPYPSIEVAGTTSNLDLSDAIMPAEFAVVSSDQDLQTATAFVEYSEIILKESDPVQVELVVVGKLPSPCHQLRVITPEPDNNGHIIVQVYSVTDPETTCAQVLEPFSAVAPLGEYSQGTFTISINNELTGDFVIP